MRILHVYKSYFPVLGGIENHVRILAEAQVARLWRARRQAGS